MITVDSCYQVMKKGTRRENKGSKVNDDAVGNNQRLPKTDT